MLLFKLDNKIKNYAWGSKFSLRDMFNIPNPNNLPQAEMWMGAHPGGGSKVAETGEFLSELIYADPIKVLGPRTVNKYGELPYLFKVLAAESPLSIQVHPNKTKSELGFERENRQNIALNSVNRNYKDPNHKPELVYALTNYKAMNGFRPVADIVSLFRDIELTSLSQEVGLLEETPNSEGLKTFFTKIMTLEGDRKNSALAELKGKYTRIDATEMTLVALEYSELFSKYYPEDIGLLSPFILNTIELAPGEAMFLHAETPHAYVHGTALEVMANSDNVLRAGLTRKHIDVRELLDNVLYTSVRTEDLRTNSEISGNSKNFSVPVDDFGFSVVELATEGYQPFKSILNSAELLFCIDGELSVRSGDVIIQLSKGESAFISYDCGSYDCSGLGQLARVYN